MLKTDETIDVFHEKLSNNAAFDHVVAVMPQSVLNKAIFFSTLAVAITVVSIAFLIDIVGC